MFEVIETIAIGCLGQKETWQKDRNDWRDGHYDGHNDPAAAADVFMMITKEKREFSLIFLAKYDETLVVRVRLQGVHVIATRRPFFAYFFQMGSFPSNLRR